MSLFQRSEVRVTVGEAEGSVTTVKVFWICRVLEKSSRYCHVKCSLCGASVDKEAVRKDGLGVCSEDTRRKEIEVGVPGNRVLDTIPTNLEQFQLRNMSSGQ